MPAAAVVTIIIVVLAVLVIARALIAIALALSRVNATLGTVISSVDQIPGKTQPVPGIVEGINRDLGDSANSLEGLLQSKGAAPASASRGRGIGPNAY